MQHQWQDWFSSGIWGPMCKLDSAYSILPISRLQFNCLCVPSFQDLFVFRSVQEDPQGYFRTGSGAFTAAWRAGVFDATTHQKKAPRHCVQVKQSLISISWKSRVYFDYSIATVKIGRIELVKSSLQIWTKISSRKIHPVTGINNIQILIVVSGVCCLSMLRAYPRVFCLISI